jgi:ADAM cysteine-rich domain
LKDGGNKIVPEKYDAGKYNEAPGQVWTAKRQCEVLLRDKDAFVTQSNGEETMCQNLLCRTPHRVGFYFAGPALQGSDCGPGKVNRRLMGGLKLLV